LIKIAVMSTIELKKELHKINPYCFPEEIIEEFYHYSFSYKKEWTEETSNREKYNYNEKEIAQELKDIYDKADKLSLLLDEPYISSIYGRFGTSPYTLRLVEDTAIYGYEDRSEQKEAFKVWDDLGTRSSVETLHTLLNMLVRGLKNHPRTKGLLKIAEAEKEKNEGFEISEPHNFLNNIVDAIHEYWKTTLSDKNQMDENQIKKIIKKSLKKFGKEPTDSASIDFINNAYLQIYINLDSSSIPQKYYVKRLIKPFLKIDKRGIFHPENEKQYETHQFIEDISSAIYHHALSRSRQPTYTEIQRIVSIILKQNSTFKQNAIQKWVKDHKRYI